MARKPPVSPSPPADAVAAALAVVSAALRAEATAQRSTVLGDPDRALRYRLGHALDSIADRLIVPAGTP